ncbi:MAG: cytochrome c-type biogenesis protein CcmH [Marinosulfonomonas sp.]|nr:cytochrome c-type biogenesis protein CcmH [Marinosulfonomonas sp.]
MRRILVILLFLATPLWAVQPDEILADPALETRARELSKGLRCPVCQSESIDESNADIARDLRLLLRERLVAGDSDAAAIEFMVARYGEYILLKPTTGGANFILWISGPVLLLAALGVGLVYLRGRQKGRAPEALSEAEKTRLAELLDQ